jgi:putative protease
MPELVLPAGDLEKLKVAFLYGADAVYLGGKEFSLRAYAENFTTAQMREGIAFARCHKGKVYVTVNILARNRDLKLLPGYLEDLAELGIDGMIVSDPGIMVLARKYAPDIPLTVSTQASVTNYATAAVFRDLGATRIVIARELSLEEIAEIKNRVEIKLEVFVHGAMCVSYSGRCLLSHYMTGRSANRGACAHPCRYQYALMEEKRPGQYYPVFEDDQGTYIMNSRDLCLLEYLPQLIDAGVDAFKIEGRMKSPLYVASAASTYRDAIDTQIHQPELFRSKVLHWQKELEKTATRPYTSGFINGEDECIQDINKEEIRHSHFVGVVHTFNSLYQALVVQQRSNFGPGDDLELLLPDGSTEKVELVKLYDEDGGEIDRARHPLQTVLVPFSRPIPEYSILRRI